MTAHIGRIRIVDKANIQGILELGDEILIQKIIEIIMLAIRKKYFHSCVKNCLIILFM